MVTMSSVWDRTTQVMAGRGGILTSIAVPTVLLPTIVRDGFVAYATPGTVSFAAIGGVLSLIVILLTIVGQLAIIAIASDPATDQAAAYRVAANRFLPVLGVSFVMGVVIAISLVPAIGLLVGSGIDFAAVAQGKAIVPGSVTGGFLAGAVLYMLVWTVLLLWIGARLVVWQPALVNERNGLGVLGRSWALTAGSTWRIIGVLILYIIVLAVAVSAAQFVSGTIFRLVLGANNVATAVFLADIVGNAVTTLFAVLAIVFTTRLYAALAETKPVAS